MTKHTPGPWEFVDNSLVGPKIDDKPVWLRPVVLRSETGLREADASLIAAAPDLLDACQGLLKALEDDCRDTRRWGDLMAAAQAAIQKATKEQV